MYHRPSLNIFKLHQNIFQNTYLGIIYNVKKLNFEQFLIKDNSVSQNHRNIQKLLLKRMNFLMGCDQI